MQLAEQKLFRNFDWILFAAVALIVALGVVMVYSATGAFIDFNDLINDYAVRQLIYAIVGLTAFGILTQVDYLVFARWRWVIYAAMIALLGIIFAIGQITHGAQRWIDFGSFQFQPSEIAKLMMVLVLAKFLADHEHDMSRWRNLALSFVVVALPALLVFLEPDLGTALIFLFSWAVMIVGAGISWRQIGALVGLTIILLPIIWFNLQSYQQQRVLTFLDPSSDPLGAGYNVRQAQIAIGTGGLWGRGIGAGIQSQLRFLRIRHADFIFSVIGEELGLLGSEQFANHLPVAKERVQGMANVGDRFCIDRWEASVEEIGASVREVERTLLLSVLLVVLVVYLFLRSGRATVIPSVAVPLAIVATFGGMYLLGYSLDNLSLMALTISTGFVVDDAIVVTENVARYVEAGEPPLQAALKGARQIGFTIVSITASLLAVFIPILLMGGIVGRLFREFAVTLAIAIAISAVVSLTLTPMMASRLLRPRSEDRPGRLSRAAERAFDGMLRGYDRALSWVLDHHALMLAVTVAAAAVSLGLYVVVPKGLFPQQDTGSVFGISDAPQDISFPAMRDRQELVNRAVMSHPAVDHAISFLGGGTLNTGNVFIQLKPIGERRETADQVIASLRPKLAQVPGIQLFLQSVQDVRVGGRFSRTQYQYTLQDANLEELNAWAPRMLEKLKTLPELRDVATDQQTSALELRVDVDRDTAARLGITAQAVDDALYDAFGQRQVATMYTQVNQYRVVLEMKPELAQHPDALGSVYVPTPGGGQVPLSAIARWAPRPTSLSVNHQGQFPAVTLSFNLAPDVSLGQALAAIRRAEQRIGCRPQRSHGEIHQHARVTCDKESCDGADDRIQLARNAIVRCTKELGETLDPRHTIESRRNTIGD